jgi:RHS repeat-associated protein
VDVYYVHTDHLDTPRKVSRASDNALVWRWDPGPFGDGLAKENPQGIGTFVYGLRFPGQYYDVESGLSYNYYRDGYDPSIGRYTQSDPIGLGGGLNPYAYADNNPVLYVDPLGLWALGDPLPQGVVNSVAGFGDGVYRVVTLGIGDLNDLRQRFDIDGGVDVCSTEYTASKYTGMAVGTVAIGGAAGRLAFRPGGFANSNRYFRMGFGRKGGNETFRAAGQWVERATGKPHVDIWTGGKL